MATTRNVSTGERRAGGRLPDQRPGRGRGGRHPRHQPIAAARAARCPRRLRAVATHRQQAREALPRRAGRRVHHRARQAVDAADPRRQAHRAGRHAHRGRPGRTRADHPGGGRAARHARARRLTSCTRSSTPSRSAPRAARRRLLATGLNVSPGRGGRAAGLRRRHRRAVGASRRSEGDHGARPRPSPTTCTACSPPRASSPAAAGAPATPRWWRASSASRRWSGAMALEVDAERSAGCTDGGPGCSARATGSRSTAPPARSSSASCDRRSRTSLNPTCSSCSAGPTTSAGWASGPTPTTRAMPSAPARYGAEGIGLCRTEHMFFETERLPHRAGDDPRADRGRARASALAKLLPLQRADFEGLFRAMDGLPGHDPADRSAAARVPAQPRDAAEARSTELEMRLRARTSGRRAGSASSAQLERASEDDAERGRGAARAEPDAGLCAASASASTCPSWSGCRCAPSSRPPARAPRRA